MRPLPYIAALALIVPAGVVHGVWVGRWSPPERFDSRLAALGHIPLKIGDWTGRDIEPEAKTWERTGVAGGLMRAYTNPRGESMTIMIVCGKPGPTSVHTPEVCYGGAGYEVVGDRSEVAVLAPADSGGTFWETDFQKQNASTPEYLRIFHAWSTGRGWRASSNPRLDFAGSRALYKLYFVRGMTRLDASPKDEPALPFMQLFLPEADKALVRPS